MEKHREVSLIWNPHILYPFEVAKCCSVIEGEVNEIPRSRDVDSSLHEGVALWHRTFGFGGLYQGCAIDYDMLVLQPLLVMG